VMKGFEVAEDGDEMTVAVNVVGHMLLAVLLLPRMRETAVGSGREAVVVFTGSFMHWVTGFPERAAERVFEELRDEGRARMADRFVVSFAFGVGSFPPLSWPSLTLLQIRRHQADAAADRP
jgi:retinol dehydrogenase 12